MRGLKIQKLQLYKRISEDKTEDSKEKEEFFNSLQKKELVLLKDINLEERVYTNEFMTSKVKSIKVSGKILKIMTLNSTYFFKIL